VTLGNGPLRVSEPQLPRKRRSAASRVFLSLFLLALVIGLAGGAVAFYGYQEYSLPGPLASKKVFEIEKGLGTPEIATKLEAAGIITDARVFSAAALLTGGRGRLKAGEYEFQAAATMGDVIDLLVSGKSIVYKISIPEGWTSDMALARLGENQVLTGDVTRPAPEGAIMPDTYVFKRGMTRQKLLEDMQAAQVMLLDEVWTKRKPAIPVRTREEAVILASIVEKETGVPEERPIIASVFMNRLSKGMRLQSDPTIIYGIAGGKGKLDRRLTRTDITAPTPYNTYTIDGLPPGPIANPGRAALEAVVNPPDTSYLYFVADGSGGHAFATTLEEHNRNVAKWRDLAGNAASAAAAETVTAEQSAADAAAPTTEPPALPAIEPDAALPVPGPEPETAPTGQPAATAVEKPAADAPAAGATKTAAVDAPETAAPKTIAAVDLKPGSVIKSGSRLIPVPKRKPKR
jgi:UPF0755 protein